MKKIITLIIGLGMLFSLVACNSNTNNTTTPDAPSTVPSEDTTPTTNPKKDEDMNILQLKIGDTIVDVA